MGKIAGKGQWLFALVTGGRRHMTCDTQIVTYDTIKHDKDRDKKGKIIDKLGYTVTDIDRH